MIYPVPKPGPKLKEKPQRLGARKEPRRSGRDRDPVYLARVRRLPCAARRMSSCAGAIEADHAGRRPLGRKSHDHEAIPMCQQHHWQRTNYVGAFEKFMGADMRRWCDRVIDATRAQLGWTPPKEIP